MKKVFINETSIGLLNKIENLPPFIFKMVKHHKTALGDNEAFPKLDGYPFDYSILKKRFGAVSSAIKSMPDIDEIDEESLTNQLGRLVGICKEMEKPIKNVLEMLVQNAVNRVFAIPEGTVNIEAVLVDRVKFNKTPRITPEDSEDIKYDFKDIAEIDLSSKAVEKRRFINSVVQGGARRMLELSLSSKEVIHDELNKINPDLLPLYDRILAINDYLLFTKKEKLDDKRPMQGSYVETHLGSDGNRTTISAQGIIFPLLLQETFKGMFELFSSHGLPKDKKKAMYIIKKADFILAEPWDMRFGTELWDMIFKGVRDSNLIPYVFTSLVSLPTDEFNTSMKEILASTRTGGEILQNVISDAKHDSDYLEFTNRINDKNTNKAVISDSYFSAAELDNFDLDGDDESGDVIQEDNF